MIAFDQESAMAVATTDQGLNFELPGDLKLLKSSIREFVEKELWPLTNHLEEHDERIQEAWRVDTERQEPAAKEDGRDDA